MELVKLLSVSVGLAHDVADTTGKDNRNAAVGDNAFGLDSFGVCGSRKLSNSSSSSSFSWILLPVSSPLLSTWGRASSLIAGSIVDFDDSRYSSDSFGSIFVGAGFCFGTLSTDLLSMIGNCLFSLDFATASVVWLSVVLILYAVSLVLSGISFVLCKSILHGLPFASSTALLPTTCSLDGNESGFFTLFFGSVSTVIVDGTVEAAAPDSAKVFTSCDGRCALVASGNGSVASVVCFSATNGVISTEFLTGCS